tara:strand:+ start:145 stop:1341 length:1197 start_codon:yes stop_codon:yes gene_type:complete
MKDKQVRELKKEEGERQDSVIDLIASHNRVSDDVLEALGSKFTNIYAEGYPGRRYYGGQDNTDPLELLTQERALKLFGISPRKWCVNVQPLSGSQANFAVCMALVPIGGKIMGMSLAHGGHLTHGQSVSATGKLWKQVPYGVSKITEWLDYDDLEKIAKKHKPHLIIAGFTAYSRIIDFKRFRKIADACGALLMVDMSHFAGLVAGGAYSSPFLYADVVTTTTHKTLRGPRHALIFARKNRTVEGPISSVSIASAIDKAIFPGLQGGPHMNTIAAVAVALKEASTPAFKKYAEQVVKNAQILAWELKEKGWRIVSGGTDSHLLLVDTYMNGAGIGGKEASDRLEEAGIITSMSMLPFDTRKPTDPSGIRLGSAAETTRGKKERDFFDIAGKIDGVLKE